MVASDNALYVFGGESFRPYAYYADVWQFAFRIVSRESPSLVQHPILAFTCLLAVLGYLVHLLAVGVSRQPADHLQ